MSDYYCLVRVQTDTLGCDDFWFHAASNTGAGGGKCYRFFPQELSFFEALAACAESGATVTLATSYNQLSDTLLHYYSSEQQSQ